ncbi:MAG: iron-sulfur cluster assembly accessory protein [Gammaproteobacteria bacterium]|jgi:iron-sulfur cluster assembly protein|nr:iron-sulfur cluster assembly accessory protein [Gammaproteobacteria bacterium]MBT3721969.1 iron-sulfur cluster assembly accessory protein [Gammaproteobacteria bacterium]MBT4078830.1 iron-sulfur cluster assembly accessory protein [Gammaproteobacteria bacterium]MBT4193266.1 iron-sulfur cluster assembly accessory protein [Gammaproteobacteria bacterium]MBT4451297.1 iron-sulfur cluster assembly accessory protein [Gammaproteobacteria bacterium]
MITVTPEAAAQIKFSAKESGINDAVLRIAIKQIEDGSLHYAMGFDDAISDNDLRFENEGVKLVIAESSQIYAQNMTLDFAELDNGEKNFIFLNPNDKNYSPSVSE